MGLTRVKATVSNPANPELSVEVELIADTGAILSWIPRDTLEKIGVRAKRRKEFRTIEGKIISRETTAAMVKYGESEADVEVVLGEKDDVPVLGVTALESLGYQVDPVTNELRKVALLSV